MTHPVLVLRPPERRGRQVALSADLLLGDDDQVTVSALVGPATQAWVRAEGKRALGHLGVRLDRAKSLLSRYVRLDGDWGKLGDVGALVFDVARNAAASPRLGAPGDHARHAASAYLALAGRLGPDAQAQAEADLDAMQSSAAQGDQGAQYVQYLIDTAHAVSSGSPPTSSEALEVCRALDRVAGGPCCEECAEAERRDRVAGACCAACASAVKVHYDAEEALLMPDETADRVAAVGADALGYRAYRKVAPKMSMHEAAARIYGIVGQSNALALRV